jgi:hypothetical protein
MSACGHPECAASTGFHDGLTFGRGDLDDHGYWEHPCATCAREWERTHPEDVPCWPFVRGSDKGSTDDGAVCEDSPTKLHEADPQSFVQADDCDWIVDVYCKHCGRSGSAAIEPEEVQW